MKIRCCPAGFHSPLGRKVGDLRLGSDSDFGYEYGQTAQSTAGGACASQFAIAAYCRRLHDSRGTVV